MLPKSLSRTAPVAYIFDTSQLRPGDILLERSNSVFGLAIKLFDGYFTHALIYVGGTDFIEAVGPGVRSISAARFFVQRKDKWCLLRPRLSSAITLMAANEARDLAFKKYDFLGAVNTKLRLSFTESPNALFCSQLVAEAYARAGVVLIKNAPASLISPNDLVTSELLERLDPPFTQMDLSKDELRTTVLQFLDRDRQYKHSVMDAERRASQHAFKAVIPMLANTPVPPGLERPGNLAEMLLFIQGIKQDKAEEIGNALLAALENDQYFNLGDAPYQQTLSQIAMLRLQLGCNSDDLDLDHVRRLIDMWSDAFKDGYRRHSENYQQVAQIAERSPLKIWERFKKHYNTLRARMHILSEGAQLLRDSLSDSEE